MQPLLGFSPDAEATASGILTDCVNLIPYEQGMRGAPTGITPSEIPVLPAKCNGACVATKLDDTRRVIGGTNTKLYELQSGVWVDVSTGTYTGGAETRWDFAQFGDATLATNQADVIQRSSGAGFAPIAYALKAKVLFSVGAFMMALNTSDATYGASTDRWWCSASYNDHDWTPNVSTLSTTGRLVSTPGKITAGGRLGEYAVVYKEKSSYIGQFVGAPAVWDFQQVPGGEFGCVGQDAWCDIGGSHLVVGKDNIHIFDGSRPVSIATGQVRKWLFANSNPYAFDKTQCVYDANNDVVWIFYPSASSPTLDKALVYHLTTKQWGKVDQAIETTLDYIDSSLTIDELPGMFTSIDELNSIAFDSAFWLVGKRKIAIFNQSHQVQYLTGPTASCGFTTGDAGDDDVVTLLKKIRLRFAAGYKPTSSTVSMFHKMTEGDDLTSGASGTMADGKFDPLQAARWHRAAFAFVGDVRITAIASEFANNGTR
jgi:hypothetical protein